MTNKLWILFVVFLSGAALLLFWGIEPGNAAYALSRRFPKLIALVLTGSAVAFSSLIFQTVTDNRILTPGILGLDALYVFIQTALLFFIGSGTMARWGQGTPFLICAGLMILFSIGILGRVLRKVRGNLHLLLLAGVITGSLFRSGSAFLQAMIDPNEFMILQGSLFASFSNLNGALLFPSGILLTAAMAAGFSRHRELDVLSLGRDHALSLGIRHDTLVKGSLALCALLISVSTALAGPVTFLGVLVTNLARQYLRSFRHAPLLVGAMLLGSTALIFGQFLAEAVFHFNTPVSVIINFAGGLYFLYLLLKESQL